MNEPCRKSYKMTEDKFKAEIEKAKDHAYVFIAYHKVEGPIRIIPSPGTTVVCEGEYLPNDLIEILNFLKETKRENIVETECDTSYYVHGSPGCRIKVTKSGEYKVICDED